MVDERGLVDAIRRHEERLARDPDSLAFAQLADLYRKERRTGEAVATCRAGRGRGPPGRGRGPLPGGRAALAALHDGPPDPGQDPAGRGTTRGRSGRDRRNSPDEPEGRTMSASSRRDPPPGRAARRRGGTPGEGGGTRSRRPRVDCAAVAAPRRRGARGKRRPGPGAA